MTEPDTDIYRQKHRKLKKVLNIILLSFVPVSLIFIFIFNSPIGAILLILSLLAVIILVWLARKYYNWTFVFLFVVVMAIIFKSQRWPLSGTFYTIGFFGLACSSFYSSVIFLKRYNNNTFLKYIGFSSSIILTVVMLGLLWKNMHWPMAGILLNVGIIVFIPFLFAFIFTLPSSNYINWSRSERIVFFRAVIIPMSFVYVMCFLMFVIPDFYRSMTRLPLLPFNMWEIDLLNMPGL